MYRVAAFDLDGTLLRSDSTLSGRTLKALQACHSHGMRLVIATGRSPKTAALVIPDGFTPSCWVCYNGAEIWNGGGRIAQNAMDVETAKEIVSVVRSLCPQVRLYAGIDDVLYTEAERDPAIFTQVGDLHSVIDRPVAKIAFDKVQTIDEDLLRRHLPRSCRFIITCGNRLGEIMTPTATKAWGVSTAARNWDLGIRDAIAFGDETNDVEMIFESGLGVAMANAHPEVKEAADHITASNDEDGVAQVLEGLLTGEVTTKNRPVGHDRHVQAEAGGNR
ncbi:MAG: HAD family hydrolase [Armatimonadetes bacterium]|nr:HAD family hydrolase [Armatimonadota bacterium]